MEHPSRKSRVDNVWYVVEDGHGMKRYEGPLNRLISAYVDMDIPVEIIHESGGMAYIKRNLK